jgi:hypothetical protein
VAVLWVGVFVSAVAVRASGPDTQQASGFTIPPTAAEKSSLTVNAEVVAAGKKLFAAKCALRHGALGKGDSEDAIRNIRPTWTSRWLAAAAEIRTAPSSTRSGRSGDAQDARVL